MLNHSRKQHRKFEFMGSNLVLWEVNNLGLPFIPRKKNSYRIIERVTRSDVKNDRN